MALRPHADRSDRPVTRHGTASADACQPTGASCNDDTLLMSAPGEHLDGATGAGGPKAYSAIGWAALGNWSGQLASLAFFFLLTHLLSPGEIGLFALAMVVQAFLGAFVDQAMGEVVVQRASQSPGDLDTAFWLDCGLAALLVGAAVLGAGYLASAMNQPQLDNIIRGLSVAVLIGTLGNVPLALLQRRLDFKRVAHMTLVSQVVAGSLAVMLALAGWGVWSLVANQLCETAIKTGLAWWHAGWRPGLRVSGKSVRSLSSYWIHTIGFRLFFFARSNADRLIIGLILGPVSLGYYTTAVRIMRMVIDTFCEGVSKAVLAIMSRMQSDPAGLERGFEQLLRLTLLATLPVLAGLAVLGPELMPLVFGAQWRPSGQILPVLCVTGIGMIVLYLNGMALRAIGRPQLNLLIFATATTLDVALLLLLLPNGLMVALSAIAVRSLLFIPIGTLMSSSILGIRFMVAARGFVPGIVACASVAGALVLVQAGLDGAAQQSARLAVSLTAAGLIYLGMLVLFARSELSPSVAVARRLGNRRVRRHA